ncbi:hypothetical protein FOL47_001315 [Perkinsus chesapeaki]|uniref:Methyltransferase FkbM domain-containing protein n=1 Tax=Perkinsus chesapeaki TaxID=330153 RepID=A0A7J6MJD1_PERCH|nr:hypothetical protein FOL47_001315 [Perkinsus chesapeaki]
MTGPRVILWIAISIVRTFEEGQGRVDDFMNRASIDVPPEVETVIVDVGTFNKTEFWERLLIGDILVLGFEPMPSKFAEHPRHPNLILLPAAVGTVPGARRMYIPEYEECATLLSDVPNSTVFGEQHQEFIRQCSSGARIEIKVPVVRLDEVLDKIPPELLPVELLKVDAQGMDLEVVLSAGRFLNTSTIKRLKLEVWNVSPQDRDLLPYPQSPVKAEISSTLESFGFSVERCEMQGMLEANDGRAAPEEDCFFVNNRLITSPPWRNCFEDREKVFELHHIMATLQYGEHPPEDFSQMTEYDKLYTLDVVAKHCCGNPEITAMQHLCWRVNKRSAGRVCLCLVVHYVFGVNESQAEPHWGFHIRVHLSLESQPGL